MDATPPWDELRAGPDTLRPQWEPVWPALQALGPEGLALRRASLQRLLRDEGVTITDTGDAGGRRAWELDPVPLVIDAREWKGIEAGLVQRAELADLVLTDIYGPRHLLRRGLLPPELVWGHPGFLRACAEVTLPQPKQLVVLATELVRGPDGTLRALAHRAQMPVGVGYAAVNRQVMSRAFPSLYRDVGVRRLSPFLGRLRAAFAALAPGQADDPRVVILTPGPNSPSYYEHAYLAAHLGFPLVEGSDLEVRGGMVWIRSVAGRERVDVVVRRVDAADLDPLELRPDSPAGVPGLLEAARRGTVSVVNPPGAGVLEHPALDAFLPAIAVHLLGEELRLLGPPTYWCGRPDERAYVLGALDRLELLHVTDPTGAPPRHGPTLSTAGREELAARIAAAPHEWAGREPVEPSRVPALAGGRLEARPVRLRTFVVAEGGAYLAMPGALTRLVVPPGSGGAAARPSKDTWVLSTDSELAEAAPLTVRVHEAAVALPGRAAEHMFAVGRNAERAEVTIRLLRTVLGRLDQPLDDDSVEQALGGLLDVLVTLTAGGPVAAEPARGRALDAVVDPARPGSLVVTLRELVDAAFAVQEQLSGDTWQVLADVEACLDSLARQPVETLLSTEGDLTTLTRSLLALAGLTVESMVRDAAWRFLDGGRRLERALALVTVLRVTLVPARSAEVEALLMESVLRAFESIIDYRRRFHSAAEVRLVLEQLVFDHANPRSLRHQLDRLAEDLAALPRLDPLRRLNPEERPLLDATTAVELADPDALAAVDGTWLRREALDELLVRVAQRLEETAGELRARYFVAPSVARLAEAPPEAGEG